MAFIETTAEADATGPLKTVYDAATGRAGRVYNILKVQSAQPRTLKASLDLYMAAMFGDSPLSRGEREMIAVAVSRANDCFY